MIIEDHIWMERVLQLAALGLGKVQPNPMVGCVIVHENRIIGEGWHTQYGAPHAEVMAIRSVKDQSLLKKATLYVNLEPCSHHGQTPPCADLIIQHQIPRVVIANQDPNHRVNGRGIARMRDAGIEVITGLLEEEGLELNKRFFTFHLLHRPYFILKWAETKNGMMDIVRTEKPEQYWITNKVLRVLSHKLRQEEQAIAIGYNTLINDEPQLTNRLYGTLQPYRFVFTRDLARTAPNPFTIIPDKKEQFIYEFNLRKIQSVIIEGGKKTLEYFIAEQLWDEILVFIGDQEWEEGVAAPNRDTLPPPFNFKFIINNKIIHYQRNNELKSRYFENVKTTSKQL
ncbi:MAG TPA: bifunctional diaminohydroxyphosphoribosylaminopyrimidine deaminase/5-amino-6-(5-phosphoribosylamino)uracil reductase RibD [Bacteroidales bacterium]|nr:bifunctional diaminohydroxyphosphoribosylaminopyrimidine deaminase/5-amino-6-(5-phosphoribosylamino)uracil reductase RibD [Bacteroidales bacterium]HQB75192.1 bifunctional diaminohydroxyphosphoribosylaminopyrimidine deaminase/5-amino-6-(5-phosphoribosylamino)uracil reductase RibD [Bacteroidales bacterium]